MILLNTFKSSHPLFSGKVYFDYLSDTYTYSDWEVSHYGYIDNIFNKPLANSEGFKQLTKGKR